ncbi:branched-chain amino acid ABC transporter permease [Nodosilinea sp. LEGE 07088]|uniref:ABC transporter permease subunit n=1 Tax=Nodosilinea sp. LEGE 07088 TaxID=2777968 RepID=UPI001880FD07|nr:branched-chain amino acid ABC transporter permease [Nodosilinea sp. LEGE 07088]MBE9138435.1 branched-chain amino acid ABC transporter permease [Nodosilinea sp. LEGE 07088]
MLEGLIGGLFNGISIGAVLLIVALGLAIVFGLMGVINLAHGELMMFGAYTTFVVQNVAKSMGGIAPEIYVFAALPLAFVVSALLGLLLERTVIRYLYGRPLETLLATWGVSLILIQLIRSISWPMVIGLVIFATLFLIGRWALTRYTDWDRISQWANPIFLGLSVAIAAVVSFLVQSSGSSQFVRPWFGAQNVDVTPPSWLRGGVAIGSALQFPYARLFIIVLTILCLVAVYWFLNGTAWGLRIRSVTQNRGMSACLGIPTERVDALTFALGSGLAGIAGFAVTLLGSVGPNLGGNYIVDAFMVVVVGGVGKLVGSIVAALVIGIVTYLVGSGTIALILPPTAFFQPAIDFFNFFATTSMAKVMVFALIIAFLQVRPAGLFPPKGRSVEL